MIGNSSERPTTRFGHQGGYRDSGPRQWIWAMRTKKGAVPHVELAGGVLQGYTCSLRITQDPEIGSPWCQRSPDRPACARAAIADATTVQTLRPRGRNGSYMALFNHAGQKEPGARAGFRNLPPERDTFSSFKGTGGMVSLRGDLRESSFRLKQV